MIIDDYNFSNLEANIQELLTKLEKKKSFLNHLRESNKTPNHLPPQGEQPIDNFDKVATFLRKKELMEKDFDYLIRSLQNIAINFLSRLQDSEM